MTGAGDPVNTGARVDALLASARAAIAPRPVPAGLAAVWAGGGLVVDIRPVEQRARDGEMPGAVVIDRNVLEWRLDPTGPDRLPEVTGPEQPIVLFCDEGYASSLAAASLRASCWSWVMTASSPAGAGAGGGGGAAAGAS